MGEKALSLFGMVVEVACQCIVRLGVGHIILSLSILYVVYWYIR